MVVMMTATFEESDAVKGKMFYSPIRMVTESHLTHTLKDNCFVNPCSTVYMISYALSS